MIGVGESYFFLGDDGFGVMVTEKPLLGFYNRALYRQKIPKPMAARRGLQCSHRTLCPEAFLILSQDTSGLNQGFPL